MSFSAPFAALLAVAVLGCSGERTPVERTLEENAHALRPVGKIEPVLMLDCKPEDAEVLLDGVLQGLCSDFASAGLRLDEDAHLVSVRKAGFLTYETAVKSGGARTALKLELSALTPGL